MKLEYEVRCKAKVNPPTLSAWMTRTVVAETLQEAKQLGANLYGLKPDQVYAVCLGMVEEEGRI